MRSWTHSVFLLSTSGPRGNPYLPHSAQRCRGGEMGQRNVWVRGCGSCSGGSPPSLAVHVSGAGCSALSGNRMLSAWTKGKKAKAPSACPTAYGWQRSLLRPFPCASAPYRHDTATPGPGHGRQFPPSGCRLPRCWPSPIHGEDRGSGRRRFPPVVPKRKVHPAAPRTLSTGGHPPSRPVWRRRAHPYRLGVNQPARNPSTFSPVERPSPIFSFPSEREVSEKKPEWENVFLWSCNNAPGCDYTIRSPVPCVV